MSRRLKFWCAVLLTVSTGCNLPGIALEDQNTPDPLEVATQQCTPNERRCASGNWVQVCRPDGTNLDILICKDNETCAAGFCQPILDTCTGSQPFTLSTHNVQFEVPTDYKTQTAAVVIENCSAHEVVIHSANVLSPSRPDGDPVYALTRPLVQTVRIAPQTQFSIVVAYQPSPGLTQVSGELQLGIAAPDFGHYKIPLTTRAMCTTATPMYSFEVMQDPQPATIWFQNCGTEPVDVTAIEAGPLTILAHDKLPATVMPGRHLAVEVWPPENFGPISQSVAFKNQGMTLAKTQIRGFIARPDCAALDVGELLTDIEQPVHTTTTLTQDVLVAGAQPLFEMAQRPPTSHATVIPHGDSASIQPDVVGRYEVRSRATSGEEVSCETKTSTIEAIPSSPFLVELTWENIADLIPEDAGPGRGVNLDLHVMVRDSTKTWLGDTDCYQEKQSCADGRATVVSSSMAGERPESVVIIDPNESFDVGVHLANPFNFSGSEARVRLWAKGTLVNDSTRLLVTNNEFWWLGRWDANRWTQVDSSFAEIPR